jgi:hypothetical protein
VYHSHQSNFKARRFDHIVNTLLNDYFGARKNPTVWLDPYAITAKTAPPGNPRCTLTANDGTHYGLCVNSIKAKVSSRVPILTHSHALRSAPPIPHACTLAHARGLQ